MVKARHETASESINGIDRAAAWKAVMRRDRAFDGRFVFAVSSTGVYCRPSCPSRRPRRENVTFFSTAKAAQEAGYRACQRCEPDAPDGTMAQARWKRRCGISMSMWRNQVTLEMLAGRIGFSKFHLQRMFKRMVGCSPKEYQDARRIERFKAATRAGKSVAEATYAAGFGSSRALYERAGDHLGMTPGQYRRGGERTRIAYATAASPIGRVLVAGTERGLCAVLLGESDRELVRHLRDEFPRAELVHDEGEEVARWLTDVLMGVRGEPCTGGTPLDLRGTEFQMRVWRALQEHSGAE